MSRFIGLDVHRDFCEVAISEGGRARSAGRVATRRDQLELFAASLAPSDRVVLEATGNALAIAGILAAHVAEVGLAHPKRLRAISHAKIKTERFDARVLAELLAAGLIPLVWVPDERTRALRRLIARRRGVVKRRTQVKNEAQAVLHRNLVERPKIADLFGAKGGAWLATVRVADDEQLTLDGALRQLDFLDAELARLDREIARRVVNDPDVRRLMTIPGVNVTPAATLRAAIGNVRRFPTARHLVGYLGLHPTVRPPARFPGPPPPPPPAGHRPPPPRTHLQGGLGRRPPRARRGRLVGGEGTRAAARVRAARVGPPRRAGRGGGRRAQAHRAGLASAHQRRGLRLPAPRDRRAQAAAARAHRRRAAPQARSQAPDRVGAERPASGRAPSHRAGRTRLPPARRRPAGQRPEGGCGRDTGARISKALEGQGRAAGHKLLTPALRHVSHPHPCRSLPQGARTRQAIRLSQ